MATQHENKRLEIIKKVKPAKFDAFGEISHSSTEEIPSNFSAILHNNGNNLSDFLETIINWYQKRFGDEEFASTYEDFQKTFGFFRSDEVFYNQCTSYFWDYFIFQKTVSVESNDISVLEAFLMSDFFTSADIPLDVRQTFLNLRDFEHSFFEITKIGQKTMIKNLYDNIALQIIGQGEDFFTKVHKGSIFQGYVFKTGNIAKISKGILLHPDDATKYIKKAIKKHKKSPSLPFIDILATYSKQFTVVHRMKNLSVKDVYKIV